MALLLESHQGEFFANLSTRHLLDLREAIIVVGE